MSLTIAIDNGYFSTKAVSSSGKHILFPSRIARGKGLGLGLSDSHLIEFGGQSYTVSAAGGNYTVDLEKFDNEINMLCTLLAIGLLTDRTEETVYLIVGLPISYYNKFKTQYRDTLMSYGTKEFSVNGQRKVITIKDVMVLPQCACCVFNNPNKYKDKESLIIDIGGLTVDCAMFNSMRMVDSTGYSDGTLTLYSKLREVINSKYAIKLRQEQMDEIFRKGYFTKDGGKVYLTEFDKDIKDYVNKIVTALDTEFPISSVEQVFLTGGASEILYSYFKKLISHVELLENNQKANQMINANAYLSVARIKKFGF
jgi:plasmid segregation protein ParM